MFDITVGEIKEYTQDGKSVELHDGKKIDVDFVIKCTGFHFQSSVSTITGSEKMYPWNQLSHNMTYFAEPLLDGGQFGSAKGNDRSEGIAAEAADQDAKVWAYMVKLIGTGVVGPTDVGGRNNPFGSGVGGSLEQVGNHIVWMRKNEEKQLALLEKAGDPNQNSTMLWMSQIGAETGLASKKIFTSMMIEEAESEA
jgi:hypothetical protein